MKESPYIKMTDSQFKRNIKKIDKYKLKAKESDTGISRSAGLANNAVYQIRNKSIGCAEIWEALSYLIGCEFEYTFKKPFNKMKYRTKMRQIVSKSMINILNREGNLFMNGKKVKRYGFDRIKEEFEKEGCNIEFEEISDGDYCIWLV